MGSFGVGKSIVFEDVNSLTITLPRGLFLESSTLRGLDVDLTVEIALSAALAPNSDPNLLTPASNALVPIDLLYF